jgi:DNA-directed RNA polymerase subunit omega
VRLSKPNAISSLQTKAHSGPASNFDAPVAIFNLLFALRLGIFSALWEFCRIVCNLRIYLNAELTRRALEKVGNPNVLVNIVSRRVRQLNGAGFSPSRPLIAETAGLGAADIALLEIAEGKLGWEMLENEAGEQIVPAE